MSNGPEGGRRRVRARLVLALAGAAVAAAAVPLSARAGSPAVTLNVALEYAASGSASSVAWTPLQVTLTNNGPDFGGAVEIAVTGSANPQACVSYLKSQFCGSGASTASYIDRIPVQLAAGTTKRFVVDIAASANAPHARLLDASGNVVDQIGVSSTASYSGSVQDAVAVVSDDPSALDSVAGIRLPDGQQPAVSHITPATLPETLAPLEGFLAVIVDDAATGSLDTAQRSALAAYVSTGGTLVIAATDRFQDTTSGLPAALVPATLSGLSQISTLPTTTAILGTSEPLVPLQIGILRPRAGATVPLADAGNPIEVDSAVDQGDVTVLALDADSGQAATWVGTLALLRHVLVTAEQRAAPAGTPAALAIDGNLLAELQDIPGLFVPSAAVLGIVIGVYVLLIAPLTFVVLWRRRHAALAWLLVPAVAVTTTAVMMATGLGTAGHDAALNVVRIVTVDPATGTARVQTLAALFSQHGGSRLIQLGAPTDATGLAGVETGSGDVVILPGQNSALVEDAGPATTHGFDAETTIPYAGAGIHASLAGAHMTVTGAITNLLGIDILDSAVQIPESGWSNSGALAAGSSASISQTINPSRSASQGCLGCSLFPASSGASSRVRAGEIISAIEDGPYTGIGYAVPAPVPATPAAQTQTQAAFVGVVQGPLAGLPAIDAGGIPITEMDAIVIPLQVGRAAGDTTTQVASLVDVTGSTASTSAFFGNLVLAGSESAIYSAPVGGGTYAALNIVESASSAGCSNVAPASGPAICNAGGPIAGGAVTISVFDPASATWTPLAIHTLASGVGASVDGPPQYVLPDGSILIRMTGQSGGITLTPPLVTPVPGSGS
ncbi:MAG TPA: hypothetical protein VND54_02895 [Candidatus Saccharimonadales bacterium]|nr:hypothetical protein [Candidatus Saccharimonadales bacterium]